VLADHEVIKLAHGAPGWTIADFENYVAIASQKALWDDIDNLFRRCSWD
jgi:hypothetical protein